MNNIELSTIYLPMLDEKYKAEAKTSVLDGDETVAKKGGNGEIKVAKLDMSALGDFDRKSGYTKGNTSLTWETVKYDKERSQDLRIDRLDNAEALGLPFGDEFATRKMTLYENHKEQEAFENYNKLSYLKEEAGGIWEVEMLQREKEDAVKIAELTMQLQEANRQITDLQLAVCELYEGMGV